MVLKPAPADQPIAWQAALFDRVADCEAFRVARPTCGAAGDWLIDGWSATAWVDGAHAGDRWNEVLSASEAFHTALARLHFPPPASFGKAAAPWRIGADVAWGDAPARARVHPGVAGALETLRPLLEAPWTGPPAQIIHGDFGGNVLFSDAGAAPAVIDFSPLVRPAAFADAIVVVDAIAWWAAAPILATDFMRQRVCGAQLLARAIAYRLVTTDQLWARSRRERADAEVAGYLPVIGVVTEGWG